VSAAPKPTPLAVLARRARALAVVVGCVAGLSTLRRPGRGRPRPRAVQSAPHAAAVDYLGLARQGVARTSAWRNRRYRWYNEWLNDRKRYPQATIWGIVPLFEALDGIAVASPTKANRAAVVAFARHAERYFDRHLSPHGGYAPYPDERGRPQTWFDDNGWWGLAFMDAYRATGNRRYVGDAQRAFDYAAAAGWDPSVGGLWWNTGHPYKSGEAFASQTLLGAELYVATHRAGTLATVDRYVSWSDSQLRADDGILYVKSEREPIPMPYEEGPVTLAEQLLCQATAQNERCQKAGQMAERLVERFPELAMGPQFDAIYLHTMLQYGQLANDGRWLEMARFEADRALANAGSGGGLYLRAWDGSDMAAHQARPGMLRTHAATVELFAWLAATPGH